MAQPNVAFIDAWNYPTKIRMRSHRELMASSSEKRRRLSSTSVAAYTLMVDAKDNAAASFYRHHDFIALPNSSRTLFLPLATVQPV